MKKLTFIEWMEGNCKEVKIKNKNAGSGTVTRTVLMIEKTKFLRSKYLSEKSSARKGKSDALQKYWDRRKESGDKRVHFPTANHKKIFQFWCQRGFPFVKHKTFLSKTNERAIHLLTQYLAKYETRQIIEAIELGHRVFIDPYFKWRPRSKRITLPSFLRMEIEPFQLLTKRYPDFPRSWLEECLKGEKYIRNKYFTEDAKITSMSRNNVKQLAWAEKRLRTTFLKKFSRRKFDETDIKFRADMMRWTMRLYNFARINQLSLGYLVKFLDSALLNFKTIRAQGIGGLMDTKFFSSKLPEALIKYDASTFERHVFNFEYDEITKPLPNKLNMKVLTGRDI